MSNNSEVEEIENDMATPEDYYVKLPNPIYDDLSISNEELTILTLLYRNYQQYKSIGISSIDILAKLMFVDASRNRKIVDTIREAITGLVEKEYILELYDLHYELISTDDLSKDTLFFVKLIKPLENYYFKVFDKHLDKIFDYVQSTNIGKFSLIRYYIACCRVSNNQACFGYLSQTKVKGLVNNSKTIQRYNKILQDDLHLIRYNNSYLTEDKHYCTTYIGHWDDEANFNRQLETEIIGKGLIYTDKTQSNERRSVQQKINNVNNLTLEELEELIKKKKELEYKLVVKEECEDSKVEIIDNRSVTEIKGIGLQNKKLKPLPLPKIYNEDNDEPDIFEDLFGDEEENDYWDISNLTIEEQKALQEIEDLNKAQIPLDVLQMIENELNEREEDEE